MSAAVIIGPGGLAVKICGLMAADEARACVELGADAIGVILAPGGPRSLDPARAAAVLDGLPPAVARVGVFVAPTGAEIRRAVEACGLTHVQVHAAGGGFGFGDLGVAAIEAVQVGCAADLDRAAASAADLVLLDASVPGRHGGTGRRFDWGLLEARALGRPFALAGGLDPDVVGEAVRRLRPAVVDVSSGVETSPGRKDLRLVERFITQARAA